MKESLNKKIEIINIIFMIISLVLVCFGAFMMLVNDGVIQIRPSTPQAPADAELIYHGNYADLLSYKQEPVSSDNDEVYIVKTDMTTGLPAVASLTQVDKKDREIVRVNTVTFNYKNRPVLLSFTNDVADKFCYLDEMFSEDNVWETDSDTLTILLADYSEQALKVGAD